MKKLHSITIELYRTTINRLFLLIFGLIILTTSLSSQNLINDAQSIETAFAHLKQLQSGNLIFVLKTDYTKRTALTDLINDPNSSSSSRKRAKKQLDKTIKARKHFHKDLVEGLHALYTFSKIYILYDYDIDSFYSWGQSLFLDADMNYDENLQIDRSMPTYWAHEAYTDRSQGTRVLAYKIYDNDRNSLEKHLPTVKITEVGPVMILKSIFEKNDYRHPYTIAERLDYKLKYRTAQISYQLEAAIEKETN